MTPLIRVKNNLTKMLMAICVPLVAACTSQSVVPVTAVFQSQQCGIEQSQLFFLENPEQTASFVAKANQHKVGGSLDDLVPPATAGRVVVVAWGYRPSSGYRLELTAGQARIDQGILTLPVSFTAPGKDEMTAQMITTPCLAVAVESREGYQHVQAGDLSVAVPGPEAP